MEQENEPTAEEKIKAECATLAREFRAIAEVLESRRESPLGLWGDIVSQVHSTTHLRFGEVNFASTRGSHLIVDIQTLFDALLASRKENTLRVLVVNDEPDVVRWIQVLLERHGYKVETANNGVQALEKIRDNRPDLLVSDVMMPEMDGFELRSEIRNDPALSDLPVIMMPGRTADRPDCGAEGSGKNWSLSYPFMPYDLVQLVDRLAEATQAERTHIKAVGGGV